MVDGLIIRQITENDSLEDLTDLLHRAYKQLADMGLKYLATYQSVEQTGERIAKGVCFVAELEGKIVGTVTYYPPDESFASKKLYLSETAWLGQMGVEPVLQKKGIGLKLVNHVEEYIGSIGIKSIGLDTSEEASHLIDWYNKLGYEFKEYIKWDITNYRSVVLVKRLG